MNSGCDSAIVASGLIWLAGSFGRDGRKPPAHDSRDLASYSSVSGPDGAKPADIAFRHSKRLGGPVRGNRPFWESDDEASGSHCGWCCRGFFQAVVAVEELMAAGS
jgi:hypothetical protein